MPNSETTPAFSPLQAATAASHAHGAGSSNAKPTVVLQRDGERVTGIRIDCPCGQVIELDCSY
jgi:hypothetical protein